MPYALTPTLAPPQPPPRSRYDLDDIYAALDDFHRLDPSLSERARIQLLGLPRSTLRAWRSQRASLHEAPEALAFFHSQVGLAWIHRILAAATLTFGVEHRDCQRGLQLFLQRSQLDAFVASSKGSVAKYTADMEQALVDFGEAQRLRLREQVSVPVDAVVQPDEMFCPGPLLDLIEGRSGFLLAEVPSPTRDGNAWEAVVREATSLWPVRILAATADQGSGLTNALGVRLKTPLFPDVFHAQYDLSRGTSAALASRERAAHKALQKARQEEGAWAQKRAEKQLQEISEAREQMHEARRELSQALHPFDPATGAAKTSAQVAAELEVAGENARQAALAAKLPETSHQAIDKVQAQIPAMAAQVDIWRGWCVAYLARQGLEESVVGWLLTVLLPILYLQAVAKRGRTSAERQQLKARADDWLQKVLAGPSPWQELSLWQRHLLLGGLRRCVGLWQRSSSQIEGRHGQVRGHERVGMRRGERARAARRVVHNFVLVRSDGSTACERMFGVKPEAVMEWVLDRVELPARPASRRPRPLEISPLLK